MATKKKTEEVAEVEVKEEKTTTKKSTSTKKTTSTKKAEPEVKAEEPVVEEVKVEEPAPVVEPIPESVVEPVVEEKPEVKVEVKAEKPAKKEEPVKVEAKKVETVDKSGTPFTVEVITPIGIYTKTAPSMDAPASKVMPFKSKLAVVDQKGNWGRLTNGKWILLSENLVRKI